MRSIIALALLTATVLAQSQPIVGGLMTVQIPFQQIVQPPLAYYRFEAVVGPGWDLDVHAIWTQSDTVGCTFSMISTVQCYAMQPGSPIQPPPSPGPFWGTAPANPIYIHQHVPAGWTVVVDCWSPETVGCGVYAQVGVVLHQTQGTPIAAINRPFSVQIPEGFGIWITMPSDVGILIERIECPSFIWFYQNHVMAWATSPIVFDVPWLVRPGETLHLGSWLGSQHFMPQVFMITGHVVLPHELPL